MRALEAIVWCTAVSSLGVIASGCKWREGSDAGAILTAYVAPKAATRAMGPMLDVAARHRWALSIRTDSGALHEADIVIVDSANRLVARLRQGSRAAAQARAMADALGVPLQ